MNLLDFFRIAANVIVFLIVWNLTKAYLARKLGTDNGLVQAMGFVTAG